MLFKLHELIILLVVGALVLIIATAALVRDYIGTGGHRAPVLTAAAYSLAEIPEELYRLATSNSPFELDDRFPEHSGFVGETNPDERYLLLNRYDGDTEKSVVELIDLRSFQVLHRWAPEFQTVDGGTDTTEQNHQSLRTLYADVMARQATHSSLLQKGSVVVSRNGNISKFNACSHPDWQASPAEDSFATNAALELDDQANIWVTAALEKTPTQLNDGIPEETVSHTALYHDSSIVQLSPSGEVIFSKSITDILVENGLAHLLFGFVYFPTPDPLHLVDIQPALSDGSHWQRGDVLISLKYLSTVLLYRPSTNRLLWHSIGHTNFQSDVDFAGESSIVIFDNNTPIYLKANAKSHGQPDLLFKKVNGHSKVLVYDFASDQYSHHLDDALRTYEVRTAVRGRSQILPNGDLFVEESEFGRLLYFSSDGSLLWSHVNRGEDDRVYAMGASRILYRDQEVALVQDFRAQKDELLAQCR